jgi:hypothetical protein
VVRRTKATRNTLTAPNLYGVRWLLDDSAGDLPEHLGPGWVVCPDRHRGTVGAWLGPTILASERANVLMGEQGK